MPQWFISRKAARKGFSIYCALILSFFIPVIFNRWYPNAGPAATFLVWIVDSAANGFVVFSLLMSLNMLRILVKDGFSRLSGSGTTPRPITLEDGTAEPAPTPAVPASSTDPDAMVDVFAVPSTTGKIFCVICYGYTFIQQAFLKGVMSLQRPLLDNVGSTLMFILRGAQVLGAAALVALLVTLVKRRSTAAEAVQAPATSIVIEVPDVKAKDAVNQMD
ncbi:hypothetical protein B0H14DRAFT_2797199 [Mycena olivaceomarginata]|nr:hypothetical protein B0H14DRAFT_2797199 [Mycena olivaceomarginata]